MNAPLVGADVWSEVITRAGDRCECRGGCGQPHIKGGGRCDHYNREGRPLHAIPREPGATWTRASGLPAAALMAACPGCHAAIERARRTAAAAATSNHYTPTALF